MNQQYTVNKMSLSRSTHETSVCIWSADENVARGSQDPNPVFLTSDSSVLTHSVLWWQNTVTRNNENPLHNSLSTDCWVCIIRTSDTTHRPTADLFTPIAHTTPSADTEEGTRVEWRKAVANVVVQSSIVQTRRGEHASSTLKTLLLLTSRITGSFGNLWNP